MRKTRQYYRNNRCGSMRKSNGTKPNITAKRLTTPIDYLEFDNKSDTVINPLITEKSPNIGPNPKKLRQSQRILKQKQLANVLKNSIKPVQEVITKKSNSKSIFREITEKYNQTDCNKILKKQQPELRIKQLSEQFTNLLHQQLITNLQLPNSTLTIKEQIGLELGRINEQLTNTNHIISIENYRMSHHSGGLNSRKRPILRDDDDEDENKENNIPLKYPFVPKSNWVFQTPPNRKLNFDHMRLIDNQQHHQNCIQPAVIRTVKQKTIVYEMNKRINVDLSNFQNKQEIDIDRRYMIEVDNLQQQQQQQNFCRFDNVLRNNNNDGQQSADVDVRDGATSNNKEQFLAPDPYELENHFLSLTCRPKKSISTVSRIRRSREMFLKSAAQAASSAFSLLSSTTNNTTTITTTTNNSSNISETTSSRSTSSSSHTSNSTININHTITSTTLTTGTGAVTNDDDDGNFQQLMMTDDEDEFESSFSLINPNPGRIEESFTFKFTPTSCKINTISARLLDIDGNEQDSFTFQSD